MPTHGRPGRFYAKAICSGAVGEYHSLGLVTAEVDMVFMLLVAAGTALALCVASLLVIQRENATT